MSMAELDEVLNTLEAALERIPNPLEGDVEARVLEVLFARDRLAEVLSARQGINVENARRAHALERRMAEEFAAWRRAIQKPALKGLQRIAAPAPEAWWWDLRVPADPRATLTLSVLALLCLAASLSVIADLCRKFLADGPDLFSLMAAISQAVIALFAASAFTTPGNLWLEGILSGIGVARQSFPAWKLAAAFTFLALASSSRYVAVEHVSRWYSASGVELYRQHNLSGALQKFDRAVNLNGDFIPARYNHAGVLSDMFAYERAAAEYQAVLDRDSCYFPAYSELAHVHLAYKSQPGVALALIDRALGLDPPASDRYPLFKHRAWAHLALRCFLQSEEDAARALKYQPQSAVPHCIIAQVREATGRDAISEWKQCVKNSPTEAVEPAWLATARERLQATEAPE